MLLEHAFGCPYCGETITITLDLFEPEADTIEDCSVCCRPIEISYRASADALDEFHARRGDD